MFSCLLQKQAAIISPQREYQLVAVLPVATTQQFAVVPSKVFRTLRFLHSAVNHLQAVYETKASCFLGGFNETQEC